MSQETKNYQYERNDFNTYGVRGSATGGGTEVVANPEGTATTDLTKLKVDDTIYGIPEGTNVVANPTLAGTESALTGLQVGDTKYAVESGMTNPMTTQYDMIVAGANGVPTRIDGGSSDYNFKALVRTNSNPIFAVISPDKITASQQNAQYKVPYVMSNSITSVFGLGKLASDFGLGYLTTAPSSDNTDGGLKMVVLTSEPATYYNGYYYIIAPTT